MGFVGKSSAFWIFWPVGCQEKKQELVNGGAKGLRSGEEKEYTGHALVCDTQLVCIHP